MKNGLEVRSRINNSDIAVQHNNLIQAKYSLTLQEQRIVLWLSSKVHKDDEEFKNHEIKITAFCNLAGIKSKNMYKEIEKTTESLMQKVLKIKKIDSNSLMQISWLSYAEYFYDEGKVVLRFDPALKDYLLALKNNFTPISLEQAFKLKSIHSMRFYQIMRQYLNKGVFYLDIQELKDKFHFQINEYKKYGDIKRRLLDYSVHEINMKTDIKVSFEEVKKGRKVIALNFYIEQKEEEANSDNIVDRANKYAISRENIHYLLKEFSRERIDKALHVLEEYKGQVKNPVLFLKKALQDGWHPFVKEEKGDSSPCVSLIETEVEVLTESKACKDIRRAFIAHKGESEYKSWLAAVDMTIEGTVLKIGVKSPFAAGYIQTHYASILKEISKGIEYVEVVVKKDQEIGVPVEVHKEKLITEKAPRSVSSKKNLSKTTKIEGNKAKNSPEKEKSALPELKQTTLWGRFKTFINPKN